MKYSFVIIAYNEQEHAETCIQSIQSQKGLGKDYEIIFVDDRSKDNTLEIVKRLGLKDKNIKVIRNTKNRGRGFSRHAGVNKATGDFIIMVDADITLPNNWLAICLKYINRYDVVGGIAVPDGDVAFIYNLLGLKTKVVPHPMSITGNNGLYRREVFRKLNFDKKLREGEDIDFNHHLLAAGFTAFSIPDLTVEHQEHKSFLQSVIWLYQNGVGATRQLLRFREVRLPDLAFFGFLTIIIVSVLLTIHYDNLIYLIAILLYPLLTSCLHISSKFYLSFYNLTKFLCAIFVNYFLIVSYYLGRTVGFFKLMIG